MVYIIVNFSLDWLLELFLAFPGNSHSYAKIQLQDKLTGIGNYISFVFNYIPFCLCTWYHSSCYGIFSARNEYTE